MSNPKSTPPPVEVASTAIATPYATAAGWIGVKEIPGPSNHPEILRFLRHVDPAVASEETAWCGAFVAYVLSIHKVPIPKRPLVARAYLTIGAEVEAPSVGWDLVILSRPGASWTGHVGFFAGMAAGGRGVKVLGGNQSNSVSIAEYPYSRLIGYRNIQPL